MSLPSKTLCINPSKLYTLEHKSDLKKISEIINIPYQKIKKTIYRNKDKKEYYLKRHISKLEFTKIEKYTNSYIYFINESKRSYLGGEAFSNVLGFTNIDDVGQEGIELAKNEVLKPSDGIKKIKKDNIGRAIETLEIIKKSKAGLDVTLTLDKQKQIIAYDVLKKYVKKFEADSASIVLIETATGNILSMANYPSFDPEIRTSYKGEKIKNRIIHDLIEPGSTIKPLIIYAGLHHNTINHDTIIDTAPGVIKLDDKEIKDWKFLGKVSSGDIIKYSSNIGAARVSTMLSKKQLINNLEKFGFGHSLYIDLPGSRYGKLPTTNEISKSEHHSIGYGYGISVSLMHLVNAYTILANEGYYTQLKYINSNESYFERGHQLLDSKKTSIVLNMMKKVVHSDDGTGKKAKVNGYTTYGKTGTVRLLKNGKYNTNNHNALFVGIVGDPAPKFVAAVIIREPKDRQGSGGYHAAPVFGEFMQHIMRIDSNIEYAGSR